MKTVDPAPATGTEKPKKPKVEESGEPQRPPIKNHSHRSTTESLMSRFDKLLAEGPSDGWLDIGEKKGPGDADACLKNLLTLTFPFH